MTIKHFTSKNAAQLLATQSRRADVDAITLCKTHFEMGKFLAYEILDEFDLRDIEIQHVQGIKTGVELAHKDKVVIFALMRAGIYAAEGIRSVFVDSQFELLSDTPSRIINLEGKIAIVVDSVINTGKSIVKIIDFLIASKPSKIIVVTLIMQREALHLTDIYQDVSFYALRISENKYVGKGETDTGNRLFNTKSRI